MSLGVFLRRESTFYPFPPPTETSHCAVAENLLASMSEISSGAVGGSGSRESAVVFAWLGHVFHGTLDDIKIGQGPAYVKTCCTGKNPI